MLILSNILSDRKTHFYPSYKIVYEWEDIISKILHLPIKENSVFNMNLTRRMQKIHLTGLYHLVKSMSDELSLLFVMNASPQKICRINKSVIPVIIDFWLDEIQIPLFIEAYKKCPLVLVTNKEVHDLLLKYKPPFSIEHWALSYPDCNTFQLQYDKMYDFCLFGRPNPFFVRLIKEYESKHPDFVYLVTTGTEKNREYYTNKGDFVCKDIGRETYLDMIRKTRISCYSTPGIDEAKKETMNYNQVTPRLFEMLCNHCHVIGHYPDSADTRWYGLSEIVPNINNYQEFEAQMDYMRANKLDIGKVKRFMSNHFTSVRAYQLHELLKKHNIQLKCEI